MPIKSEIKVKLRFSEQASSEKLKKAPEKTVFLSSVFSKT